MANKKKSLRKPSKEIYQSQNQQPPKAEKPPSWAVVRGILTCRQLQAAQIQQQKPQPQPQRRQKEKLQQERATEENSKKCKKMKCSGSLCSNTKVTHRPEYVSPEILKKRALMAANNNESTSSSSRSMKVSATESSNGLASTPPSLSSSFNSSSLGGSFKGMPFRRLSGCYECRMVVDPILGIARDPSLRGSICSCPECGEIFMKAENVELHQAVRHAVSELGPEDTSKNIVEIIFQSSWLKKQAPICKIDRILKVHNTQRIITKFEEYRDSIKAKAAKLPKKHPRCIADGNELLRFHCTTFSCPLGLNGSSNLCNSFSQCNVCNIIKNGFKVSGKGILTTATSGKAHDRVEFAAEEGGEKRAMLVCRVIAGRVKKNAEANVEEYDSVGGGAGVYSNLDELYVFNPKAILPCFVVIYGGF